MPRAEIPFRGFAQACTAGAWGVRCRERMYVKVMQTPDWHQGCAVICRAPVGCFRCLPLPFATRLAPSAVATMISALWKERWLARGSKFPPSLHRRLDQMTSGGLQYWSWRVLLILLLRVRLRGRRKGPRLSPLRCEGPTAYAVRSRGSGIVRTCSVPFDDRSQRSCCPGCWISCALCHPAALVPDGRSSLGLYRT